MLKKERHAYIIQQINVHNKVLSSDLSVQLTVSEDTVRRDLQELSEEGKLIKVHGGALSKSFHFTLESPAIYSFPEKRSIALKAIPLIKDGMLVLLSGGTTIRELVKALPPDLNATFITVSIPIALELLEHPSSEVIFIGNKLLKNAQMSVGAEVIQRLGQLHKLLLISLQKLVHNKKQKLALAKHRLVDPQKKLQDYSLRNDDLYTRLEVAIDYKLSALKKDIQVLRSKMVSPEHTILNKRMRLQKNFERMNLTFKHYIQTKDHQIKNMMSLLDSFSPLKVVDRGYSIAKVKDKVIRSVKQVKKGDEVTIKMTDGILVTEVKDFIQ